MLMMPITPKVMARPMAASSRTEPSDSPYQAFCTDREQHLPPLDRGGGALQRRPSRSGCRTTRLPSSASVSCSPRSPDDLDGRDFLGVLELGLEQHGCGAGLGHRTRLILGQSPWRSRRRAQARRWRRRDLNTASAAERRLAGIGIEQSERTHRRLRSARRTRLFTRTGLTPVPGSPVTAAPVRASMNLPSSVSDEDGLVGWPVHDGCPTARRARPEPCRPAARGEFGDARPRCRRRLRSRVW